MNSQSTSVTQDIKEKYSYFMFKNVFTFSSKANGTNKKQTNMLISAHTLCHMSCALTDITIDNETYPVVAVVGGFVDNCNFNKIMHGELLDQVILFDVKTLKWRQEKFTFPK